MKSFDDEFAIYNWMRNRNTVEFLGVWEKLHSTAFDNNKYQAIENRSGRNNFNLTPQKWIKATKAIGIFAKSGRHGGDTFAHQNIAVNFCYWLSST